MDHVVLLALESHRGYPELTEHVNLTLLGNSIGERATTVGYRLMETAYPQYAKPQSGAAS